MRSLRITAVVASCALATLLATFARTEELGDPMRPPSASAPTPAAAAVDEPAAAVPSAKLSAIWSVGRRRYALVDSARVEEGAKIGDDVVIRITDTTVVLEGAEGERVLSLTDGIDKRVRENQTAPPVTTARKTEKPK